MNSKMSELAEWCLNNFIEHREEYIQKHYKQIRTKAKSEWNFNKEQLLKLDDYIECREFIRKFCEDKIDKETFIENVKCCPECLCFVKKEIKDCPFCYFPVLRKE